MEKEEGMGKEEMQEGVEEQIAETPEEEIRRLAEQLEARSKEAAENYDRYLRALADLENFRKRTEKEKADAEPGTVVKEFQKGYYLKGRLLRPAMVAVAKRPESH